MPGTALFGNQQLIGQLLVEQAPVGQPRQAVLIGFGAQFFAAGGLFGEQPLELFDHLVHRQHHPLEFRGVRQFGGAEKLPVADGFGLLDHGVQRTQLSAQQPATKHGTEQAAQQ
ncbi:hypothetical protein D3C85_620000 [compost metagenome]